MNQLTIQNVEKSYGKRLCVDTENGYKPIGKLVAFNPVMLNIVVKDGNDLHSHNIAEHPMGIYIDDRGFWKRIFNLK